MLRPDKYFRYLIPSALLGTSRTKELLNVNPVVTLKRKDAEKIYITAYSYCDGLLEQHQFADVEETFRFKNDKLITWINIDGLRKRDVELIGDHFGIHPLITEDIMSMQQRPKMDEIDQILYCLLNMLYFNETTQTIEQEQISIVLGKDLVITFQEDAQRDVFTPVREKLKLANSKVRQFGADYLCYSLLDMIVDNYFFVMEKLGDRIEQVEDEVIRNSNSRSLSQINNLRKEVLVLKRNITPVRDLIGGIIRSESPLLDEKVTKYYKDIFDHITQAYELNETYRDIMISMQDLYINNVNLKMNEVMKVLAIVTCLMAPATVIGGIFGMNFDANVSFFHKPWGFYTAVVLMLLIPVWMLTGFKKRGWF